MCYLTPEEFIDVEFLLYGLLVNKKEIELWQVAITLVDELPVK